MNKTLVVLAAGMGSRFGGIKQIEPVGPNGEIISDYNIYNAIKYGFNKLVFIIREEHLDYFEKNITPKFKNKIKVVYAFQELDSVMCKYEVPETRTKMLGTVHALLCAKDLINEPFASINADDFYGEDAFKLASQFIDNNQKENDYLTVNYKISLVSNGLNAVKRGICYTEDGIISKVLECKVTEENGVYTAQELDKEETFEIEANRGCAMNFFVFKPSVFDKMMKYYEKFMENVNDTNEALLSIFLNEKIAIKEIKLHEVVCKSKWMGVTYKEDLPLFIEEINNLIALREYPRSLWED